MVYKIIQKIHNISSILTLHKKVISLKGRQTCLALSGSNSSHTALICIVPEPKSP